MQELCVATGLGRSSIYNTFSGKRDLSNGCCGGT
ncbi:hypothetical protein [Nocardia sp. GAS34]